MIYVRPVYVEAAQGARIPELRRVIVVASGRIIMRPTLKEALEEIFGAAPATNEAGAGEPDPPDGPDTPDTPEDPKTSSELLQEAQVLFAEADAALQESPPDLVTFAEKYTEARELVQQALEASGGAESGSTTTTTPESTTSTTGTPA